MKRLLLAISLFLVLFTAPLQAGKIDINTADAQTLQENLDGVGEVKAKAIVKYRRQHGKFKTMDDLMQVPGIGEETINKNRNNLSLKGGSSKSSKKPAAKKSKSAAKKTDKTSSKKKSSTRTAKTTTGESKKASKK